VWAGVPSFCQQQANRPQDHKARDQDKPWVLFGKKESPTKEQERVLRGQVTDVQGNALEGAVVEVKLASGGKAVSMVTNKDGRYEIAGLFRAEDYEVKADHKKLGAITRKVSRFDARKEVQINFRLGEEKEQEAEEKN
jgi:hypothetical protein